MTDRRPPSPRSNEQRVSTRPDTEIADVLEVEGIRWEGPVILRGNGEVRAYLALTGARVVLLRDRTVVLEVPESWLRPTPQLIGESGVRLFVTPEGARSGADETDRLMLRVVEGRSAAERLVAALGGITASTRPTASNIPRWSDRRQAAPSIALPPLPDFGEDIASRRNWPPVEQHAIPAPRPVPADRPKRRPDEGVVAPAAAASISSWANAHLGSTPEATSASGLSPASSRRTTATRAQIADNDTTYPVDEPHQFNRGLVWGLRVAILLVLVTTGLYFGRDRLPANLEIPLPSNVQEQLGLNPTEASDDVSQLGADQTGTGSQPGAETATVESGPGSDGTSGPPNGAAIQPDEPTNDDVPADEPAVGGQPTEQEPEIAEPPAEPTSAPTAAPTTEPAVAPTSIGGQSEATEEPTTIVFTDPEPEAPVVDPTAVPTEEPTAVPTEEPTAEPTAIPTEVATEEPIAVATEVATEEPTAVATEVATEEPTAVPTEVATEEPTETATEEPTAEPTAIPTEVATEEPTAVPTEVATEEPTAVATEEAVATLESQPASVAPNTDPDQAISDGIFRYEIQGAAVGDTIPELPEVNAVGGYGEWVVLSVYGENWSDSAEVFDMSTFRLYADDEEILLDVGNAWISGMLGNTPAYGNTDAIQWAANEGHTFTLTFLAPPDAETLVLRVGDQSFDLSETLADPAPLTSAAQEESLPEYIEADVVDVIDAETIVIEQDGIEQTVRYLGIDVPTESDCYAEEATARHTELVEGQTVRIERQVTDVDARGNWVRDVWVADDEGRFFLVAERLVAEGVATAAPSEPNTRFASWLLGSQAIAEADGVGLWGACGDATQGPGTSQATMNNAPPIMRTGRRVR